MLKLSYAERSGAGAYEQERFIEARRAWRKRVLPAVRWVTLPAAAIGLAYAVLGPASRAQWFAGFVAGALACMYLWARDEVPEHIWRHGVGAQGERATATALRPLSKEGWQVFHNIDCGRGNRDHVVVGQAGVFLLDSKRLGGVVTVEGDALRVERVDDPSDGYVRDKLAGHMRGQAAKLSAEIAQSTSVRTWVTAVVVIWSRFDARVVQGDNIVFLHGDELVDWLRKQPRRLGDEVLSRIGGSIDGGAPDRRAKPVLPPLA